MNDDEIISNNDKNLVQRHDWLGRNDSAPLMDDAAACLNDPATS
jgi:hypothetical protein